MNFLNQFFANDALHALSQGLLIPTVVCLVILAAYAVYTLGSLVVEVAVERRRYRVALPRLIADLDAASYGQLDGVIDRSGLLDSQRNGLRELVSYMYLPEDALTEVAKRLLADESARYQKALSFTDSAVKIAPMLGLMGTLIPLGPGIVALSSGDLETLSSSLLVAFDTTVAGLAVAVVCFLVTKVRRRWYADYLISVEGAMNTILEKADVLHAEGFAFPSRAGFPAGAAASALEGKAALHAEA
ncbi:MotA/TolQ/ExbB proton channel family protein [Gordonibacter massiliensis (ex Traore et al. 2017)]|uniref:MotA/TolQ/ExbB proton channel family protein n=1 Tax=Gordonibacter massiliensis (ex Traore et al. 2017) TaxID=1841863 RepID=UPI001C8B5917|nr:MotA/TolQ/ExbB proton channel family protein [Gordonibacter massiliensis (ex Traore et al. 2017)]MBX9034648.1 MotA/TolQ/ExbB proton channel family protein [Gordonibacter massiliensis (ex Traore et al. 2017)]